MIDHKDSFIGLDMADVDTDFDENEMTPLFEKARQHGIRITAHAGESPWSGAIQQIRNCVDLWGAERIGHGVQVVHDPATIQYLIKKQITLETCPLSNYLTQSFPTYEGHPLRALIDSGLKITLNSDDPGIFGSTLSDDYQLAHQVHQVSAAEFTKLNQTAAEASFISLEKKQTVWPWALKK